MKLLSRFSNRSKLLIVGALLALGVVAVPTVAKATLGSDRPTKVYTQGVAGFDHPTFNSFTNVPNIGDERNFFNGLYSDSSAYTDPMPQVKDGEVLTLEVYVHNGADPSLNASGVGIAKDTSVRVALPGTTAKNQQAEAFISSSTASPTVVSDTLDMGAANGGFFSLAYVPGSAHIKGNYIDAALPDTIVGSGAKIGTDALNGDVKGCFEQMVVVTIKVKVNMPRYSINKKVDIVNQTHAWVDTENAKGGQSAAWQIGFTNTGATTLSHVDIVDQVPAGLTVVPGSVKLVNGNYPAGTPISDSAIQDNGRTVHVNIGDYAPGDNAYLYYTTTIDQPGSDVCTPTTLVNKAFATPEGFGAIWEQASVTVAPSNCNHESPTYSCKAFTLTVDKATRTVTVASATTSQSTGATFDNFTIDWSDKTAQLMSDSPVGKTHQFAADGNYTVTAVAHFTTANGAATNTNANCAQTVSFSTTPQPPTKPTTLVNTGAGDVAALFGAVAAASAFAYRLFLGRRVSE
ncbi:MAG: exported protein of unknown function [Candidatus Saccharibacteria bacterium]|nr:exported protein of unknown function [Candidatus Saccharibacteria bacterium]